MNKNERFVLDNNSNIIDLEDKRDKYCLEPEEVVQLLNEFDSICKQGKKPEARKIITTSLDTNQAIYISERNREELFKKVLAEEEVWIDIPGLYDYMFSAENLERYCLGATARADYAYKRISKLLRKEYEEWKTSKLGGE